jgi:hypothetical protein
VEGGEVISKMIDTWPLRSISFIPKNSVKGLVELYKAINKLPEVTGRIKN